MNYEDLKRREQNNEKDVLVYSDAYKKGRMIVAFRVIATYALIYAVFVYVSKIYLNFGKRWIAWIIPLMLLAGAITAHFIKEEEQNTLHQTKLAVLALMGFWFLYRLVISHISGITSEEMNASLGITITATSGAAVSGMLQNILMIISVMTPIGYIIWCAQKFKHYKMGVSRRKAYDELKNMDSNRGNRRF